MMVKEKEPPGLKEARRRAEKLIGRQNKLNKFLNEVSAKLKNNRTRLQKIIGELDLLLQMVKAYHGGEYRRIPAKALVTMVAALLYFINPFDIIPDFITGLGFLDDAAVIGFVMKSLREEITLFQNYLKEQQAVFLTTGE